jgi:hypothetical protein
MKQRNIGSHSVSMESFLSQEGIRQGIYDAYKCNKFKTFFNQNYAVAYERGRHIGICARLNNYQMRHLYDDYGYCRGKPTDKLISLAYQMRRKRWMV